MGLQDSGLVGMNGTHGKELRDVTTIIGRRSNCAHTLMTKSPIAESNIPCLLNCSTFVVISSLLCSGKKAKISSSHFNISSTNN